MELRDLPIRLSYTSKGKVNILDDFLIPALKCAKCYKRSVGFFSSSVFELINAGLETFIKNKGEIKIVCSPELSLKDKEAIELGYEIRQAAEQKMIIEELDDALKEISDENLIMLIDLIKNGQLNIKIVDVEGSTGIYHDKIGLLEDFKGNKVLFVGSPNESKNAYQSNYEKIRVSKSWASGDMERILDDEEEFDAIWNGTHDYIRGVDCTDIIETKLAKMLKNRKSEYDEKKNSEERGIILRDYQREAIDAWMRNGKQGFFVMATGTGKTWTAIYAALEVTKEEKLFLVVCAPYKHLVRQWYEDIHKVFSNCNTVMVSSENQNWENQLLDVIYESKYNHKETVIAISTIKSFNSDRFQRVAKKASMKRMLIVDEAHRFKNTSDDIKKMYPYMLGLSATPSSKKNDEFGEQLMNYFGGQVYNLPIEFAIEKNYLVHYNYYPIYVNATDNEEREFNRYTSLMASCFRNNRCIDLEGLAKFKRGRLRVISMAEEKNSKINWILSQIKENNHFIVYCGDGRLFDDEESEGIRHIQYVKEILTDLEYKVSQFTAKENIKERMQVVNAFNKGMIDAMVAIRCLDEGINIPSIEGALLLSSNDDYREFVQRRGRILRTYHNEYTGKEKKIANIYDVIVLPSTSEKNFAQIELRRYYEYARLADNRDECIRELEDLMFQYEITEEEIIQLEDNEEDMDE